jgi:hypothetical protein
MPRPRLSSSVKTDELKSGVASLNDRVVCDRTIGFDFKLISPSRRSTIATNFIRLDHQVRISRSSGIGFM